MTLCYKVLFQYFFVLLCTTKYYSSTTPYWKYYSSTTLLLQSATPVLLQYRKSFQNDRFVRGFIEISQKKLPKRAFRAKLPTIITEEGSKMIVSCEASSKFHKRRFQNERFVRSFLQFFQDPRWSFRARLPPNFTEKTSKTSVSCEASDSQKKVPKWSFRARLHRNFTKEGSKTSVSREASPKFYKGSFQNDRFVRGFFEISQNKLPKRAFRVKLPTIFPRSKMIVSCEASSKFHRKSFQNERFVRCFRQFSQKKLPKGSFRAMLSTILQKKNPKGPKA